MTELEASSKLCAAFLHDESRKLECVQGIVWMELFEIVCKMLLFTTVLLNILTERVFHTWHLI